VFVLVGVELVSFFKVSPQGIFVAPLRRLLAFRGRILLQVSLHSGIWSCSLIFTQLKDQFHSATPRFVVYQSNKAP
jgi:hypothetical protein